jgi:hypothetical protein
MSTNNSSAHGKIVWDLDRKWNYQGSWPKHLKHVKNDLQSDVHGYLQEHNDRNIKKDSYLLARALEYYGGTPATAREDIDHFTVIIAFKHVYGAKYITLRYMAIQTMPSSLQEQFGYLTGTHAKKQMEFNRGDFKKAAKMMGFNPALIRKDDVVISRAIEDVGRKVINPDQLVNRVSRDLSVPPDKAKIYLEKYKFVKTVQKPTVDFNVSNVKDVAVARKVLGNKDANKKIQDAWADAEDNDPEVKKYTQANKRLAQLNIPQHAKVNVKELLKQNKQ